MTNEIDFPEQLIPWLFHEDSLTQKLKLSTGDASIQVLSQGLKRADWWDKQVLGFQEQRKFSREIIMSSHKTCCWYARMIAPESTYQRHHDFFMRLETSALHVMLFQEKLAVRKSMKCYAISNNELEFYWVKSLISKPTMNHVVDNVCLWARRCCFLLGGKEPLYLVEIFLPQFLDLLA